jgi:ACT domain-containing protein
MTFSLRVDSTKFRGHLVSVMNSYSTAGANLVPVIKGNGYGFGRGVLASEASRLGCNRIAIGTVWELGQSLADFPGNILVLEPFNSTDESAVNQWRKHLEHNADRIIVTVSNLDLASVRLIGAKNIYLEGKTSLSRFGIYHLDLQSLDNFNDLKVLGLSLHSPIVQPVSKVDATTEISSAFNGAVLSKSVTEVWNWIVLYEELSTKFSLPKHISLSHISEKQIHSLKSMVQSYNFDLEIEVRLGTKLWLGEPNALQASGTVLQIHEMTHRQDVGYQQVDSGNNKRLIVVSGGTAHGVAMAAPSNASSLRKKGIAIAEGVSQALGKVRSPFSYKGENLIFAEPPHMQVSMLWSNDTTISVGDNLDCNVRNTTTNFDCVVGLD